MLLVRETRLEFLLHLTRTVTLVVKRINAAMMTMLGHKIFRVLQVAKKILEFQQILHKMLEH